MIYDKFQNEAIACINEGCSVLVSAPTGAGKTAIAEHLINCCREKQESVIYTAPIKALSNQKFRDFNTTADADVGILTGDVSINQDASLLIMTTEIFRNRILENPASLEKYSWIIFDEIHFIDDYERGTVWEESLIFLPEHMKVLGLSATVPNIDKLAEWLKKIHNRPVKVVKENKRPVPLHFYFQCSNEIADNIRRVEELCPYVEKTRRPSRRFPPRSSAKPNSIITLIKHLQDSDRLPCIYFSFARKRCEELAEEICRFDFLNPDEKNEITSLYNELCVRFGLEDETRTVDMKYLIARGIAYHHAGMLPAMKEVVERLFTSRLIKAIFTTETFALGINMPARTVIFDELRKFYGTGFDFLRTRDFYQMAGRAGRRGMDPEGFVYSRINPRYITPVEVKKIIYRPPEEVKSRFNASYATILNLYQRYNENLYNIYSLSFYAFSAQGQTGQKRALEMMRGRIRVLKETGCIRNNSLTEKGKFASKVYGYELPMAELYEKGILVNLSPVELGVVCISLIFEPRKHTRYREPDIRYKTLKNTCLRTAENINRKEKKCSIYPPSKNFYFHLSSSLESWMKGESFEKALEYTDADEGEVVRYFRMSVQVMRDLLETPAPESFRDNLKKAVTLINRDLIDAERELRAG